MVRLTGTKPWSGPGSTEGTDHWGPFRARAGSLSFVSLAMQCWTQGELSSEQRMNGLGIVDVFIEFLRKETQKHFAK